GNDLLDAEKKGGNRFQIRGNFNMLICTNTRLRVKLDGDTSAWRRRLLIVEYGNRPQGAIPIPGFDSVLLHEEAAGILNWMVAGAVRLLAELDRQGDFVLTAGQMERIENLLSESDSIRQFARKAVVACDAGDVTVDELVKAYGAFCEMRGWEPLPVRRVETELRDVMLEIHHASKRNDIQRNGKSVKGFAHLKIVDEEGTRQ
ncbi:MAG: primase-like DNA-binding domain-containing protein, partial [Bacteroidota bacterium]